MKRVATTAFLLILFLQAVQAASRSPFYSASVEFSWVMSDNVFESVDRPYSDHAGRMLGHFAAQYRRLPLRLALSAQAGLEGYSQYSAENRYIHDAGLAAEFSLTRHAGAGMRVSSRCKRLFNSGSGYDSPSLSPFLAIHPFRTLSLHLYGMKGHSDYVSGRFFDYAETGFGIMIRYHPFSILSLTFSMNQDDIRFERSIWTYLPDSRTFQILDEKQEDGIRTWSVQAELYWHALIRIGYSRQACRSNSYGYAYTRPQFTLVAAKALPERLTVNFFMRLEWKTYRDSLAPQWIIHPDSETEENNFIWLSLSRDLSGSVALKAQTGWYRNESPFRNRYYSKHFYSLGLCVRF
ncbi:hypothetical protein JW906_09375 [bacterium]|nr:hypothetical protein [bacterium]